MAFDSVKGNFCMCFSFLLSQILFVFLRTPHYHYDGNGEPDPLISALLTNSTHLRELNLSNSFGVSDKVVEDLTKILVDPGCHLEKLV